MEIWRDVIGFPGYLVSNQGRLKSIKYRKERLLKPSDNSKGYLRCRVDGRYLYCHQAVAKAFLNNPDNKTEIDHINRKTSDNRVENLRWATRSENSLNRQHKTPLTEHKYIHQNLYGNYKVHIRKDKLTVYNKTFSTLTEAITARDKYLQAWTS